MKKDRLQYVFLEHLKKVPVVQVACEKVGISRNTIYRWRDEDKVFCDAMDLALNDGCGLVNDMCESQIMNHIKQGHFSALTYWLSHHHPKYKNTNLTNIKVEPPKQYILPTLPKEAFEKVMISNLPKLLRKRVAEEKP